MTLVDRYLRAVKEQLPRAQQDDIIGELSEHLRAQIEDEEAARGRPLADAEQAAILKRFGNPMIVAARYRGDSRSVSFGRRLIGPELFPTYAKVLKINVVVTVIVMAVILLIGGGSLWSSIYGGLVPIAVQFAIVTGIFIAADRRFASDPDRWDPFTVGSTDPGLDGGRLEGIATHLIGPAKPSRVPYSTSLFELAVGAFGLAWLQAIGVPDATGPMAPGPGWRDLYAPFVVLFAVGLVPPIVALLRPTWTRLRAVGRVLFDGVFVVLLVLSLVVGRWIVVVDPATATPTLVEIVGRINATVAISIVVTMAFAAVSLVLELRRLRQMRT